MTTSRYLRSIGPNKWAVIIDTHTAEDEQPDPDYGVIPVTGRRPLGEPVATIEPLRPGGNVLGIRINGVFAEAADTSPVTLAERIADGEFDDDFRYEYFRHPEPDSPSDLYVMTRYATPSQKELERFSTDDPGREVEAAREAQTHSLEERLGPYGLEWEREQRDRQGRL